MIVPEDQLSLAIGKDGQNVRLAAKLTDFKIDIKGPGGSLTESEKKKLDVKEKVKTTKTKKVKKVIKKSTKNERKKTTKASK